MHLSSLPITLALPLIFSASLASAQANWTTYASECISALRTTGYTGLANALQNINNTESGAQLFSQLASGANFTVFAPDAQALKQIPSSISNNASLFAEYISYHIVEGDFTNTTSTSSGGSSTTSSVTSTTTSSTSTTVPQTVALFGRLLGAVPRSVDSSVYEFWRSLSHNAQPYAGIYPNVTIGRTLLNSTDFVHLEGNKSQVLVWTRYSQKGKVNFLNQISPSGKNISVVNSATWRNLFINTINGLLIPPGNITTALNATNATSIFDTISSVQFPAVNGTNETVVEVLQNATGITFFVPNNAAFTSEANATLAGLQGNATAIQALVQNHYINGTTLYSTQIDNSTTAVSAAGENFTFFTNGTGTFVSGPNNTVAQIVRPDVLLDNGVAHIIDTLLIATDSNSSAASSAYSSATSAAAQTTIETGPIVAPTTTSSSSTVSTTSTETTSTSSETSTSTTSETTTSTSSEATTTTSTESTTSSSTEFSTSTESTTTTSASTTTESLTTTASATTS